MIVALFHFVSALSCLSITSRNATQYLPSAAALGTSGCLLARREVALWKGTKDSMAAETDGDGHDAEQLCPRLDVEILREVGDRGGPGVHALVRSGGVGGERLWAVLDECCIIGSVC